MTVTVFEGSTFCVCDERGDVDGSPRAAGFFASDTRFLSRCVLTIGGARPEPLSQAQPMPHIANFVLRNAVVDGIGPNELSIERERFVSRGMEERIVVVNHGREHIEFELALELAVDFADIFAVKSADPGFAEFAGASVDGAGCPPEVMQDTLLFVDRDFPARSLLHVSQPCTMVDGAARFVLVLDSRAQWEVAVSLQPLLDGVAPLSSVDFRARLERERARARASLGDWQQSAPRLGSPWNDLTRTWDRSVADLAALRIEDDDFHVGALPAAGAPWFMTVFGRDTLITCLQTLVFGPDLSASALRELAATQATEDDPERDAEPGKIIHEMRRGKAARAWTDRYYGSVDATPLFLILLSEHWRWTDDPTLVHELAGAARSALAWIDGTGDRDGDGFVEYERRARRGIRHQSWKDSDSSMVFHDGSFAEPPIASAEVQGYVYDAKLRLAEIAREVWGEIDLAVRLESEARRLQDRFNEAFWVEDRGIYALGLDREKRPIDAVGSNMGHLLWSGIVPEERAGLVASTLMSDDLWSGWGVRTLSSCEIAYNPLVYHNGTVWPHDNSLAAWGLARAGHPRDAEFIFVRMIEAAVHFDYRLPEVFAGFRRTVDRPPVAYPTASSPQAWAAGTPVLLLQVLLGIEPERSECVLRSRREGLPLWAEGLVLSGIHAYGRLWTASVQDGAVAVATSR
ncbi:MAG: amylo-alpha-1,6-glucosidase [Actinomycetota bacterium]|nr:amylo-alpha-1,6-glucosidase [Actinomycetota bacterium]